MFACLAKQDPGRTVKQEHEEISRNHVQTFISPSVKGRFIQGEFTSPAPHWGFSTYAHG